MKLIPTYVHGIFDYLGGLVLLFAPELFLFEAVGGAAVAIPRILGVAVLLQALTTDYEVSVVRMVPMRTHLAVDYAASIFLALSPWLFGFAEAVWVPHVAIGAVVFIATLMTEPVPRAQRVTTAVPGTDAARWEREEEVRRRANLR